MGAVRFEYNWGRVWLGMLELNDRDMEGRVGFRFGGFGKNK